MRLRDLKQRAMLLTSVVHMDEDGSYREEVSDFKEVWGVLQPLQKWLKEDVNAWGVESLKNGKRYYKFAMQKNNIRNALHADIYGLRFRSKKLKLVNPIDLDVCGTFVEMIVMDDFMEGGNG